MMYKKALSAVEVCIAGLVCSLLADPAFAQGQMLGEYRSECQGREIVVWTTAGDLRIFRGQARTGGHVATSSEIVWLCVGGRRTFFCQQSERANYIDVEWQRSGEVTFVCLSR